MPRSINPFALLDQLKGELSAGELSPEVRRWLAQGLIEFEAQGGRKSLCVALGLRGRGRRSLATREHLKARDNALRCGFALVPGRSDAERLRAFSSRVLRFKSIIKPYPGATPPPTLDHLGACLWTASLQAKLPATTRQLRSIVRKNNQRYSFPHS
ncbi:MAG: hypothetical protein ACREV4_08530 [Gammaproteobacteria bacterium]